MVPDSTARRIRNRKFRRSERGKRLTSLSHIEDRSNVLEVIGEIGIIAGRNASKALKEAGLPRIYFKSNNTIVKISEFGNETILSFKVHRDSYFIKKDRIQYRRTS